MPTVSATIITKNEEKHLKNCLDALLWVDEIIVLDCGSTDKTKEICEQYAPKLRFHETDWPGYGKQRERARKLATSEWFMPIDADEVVSKELQDEIIQTIKDPCCSAYVVPFLNHFKKRPLKHCFRNKGHMPIRLAKRDRCEFSEDVVHEALNVDGKIGELKNFIYHYNFDTLEKMLWKMNTYSSLNASKMYDHKKKTNPCSTLAHALWVFIRIYFINLGFLDGWPGFIVAFANFEGTFYKYAKLLEKE